MGQVRDRYFGSVSANLGGTYMHRYKMTAEVLRGSVHTCSAVCSGSRGQGDRAKMSTWKAVAAVFY